ncbi:hypothetical protein FRC09_002185, partial [Ceratobasidium sp. 395]
GPPEPEGTEDDENDTVAMVESNYSKQLTWKSQSKENMDFTPEQLARCGAYRHLTLNKQSVHRFVHQSLRANVSVNVAQVFTGFPKVFVGEIIELARHVQEQSLSPGTPPDPLLPDHLRTVYQLYVQQTGHVGSAKPTRG